MQTPGRRAGLTTSGEGDILIGQGISFREQMRRTLNRKNRFGQSRQDAKHASHKNGHGGKVDGIYGKKTMKDYIAAADQFDAWQLIPKICF